MTLKYCQSHKCHTYDTKDRKRGSKGNRVNQTRRRSEFYYGGGNFCSLNCYNDWASDFMDRAIDQVSGGYDMGYFWYNSVSERTIDITREEYLNQSQPPL